MVWKDRRSDEMIEAVRVCAYSRSGSLDWTGWVEVKRTDGSHVLIHTIERRLPRNGGKARFSEPNVPTILSVLYTLF